MEETKSSSSWRQTLQKTRQTALGRLATLFGASDLTPEFWDQLEEILLHADAGVDTTTDILDDLKRSSREDGLTKGDQVERRLRSILESQLKPPPREELVGKPHVILLVGVNGSGKTTTAAKIAQRWIRHQHSVLFAAADTYRAAASEQLQTWGQRLNVDVICGQPGSDPGAVVFDACTAAISRGIDIVIVDTSGRMHTQHNLMQELGKIRRVAGKVVTNAPHETLLVLDATTGQNGLSQAKSFSDVATLSGVVLAKLDNSAKGGVAFAVARKLGLPIQYVGTGETPAALQRFDATAFVDSILPEMTA
jgi:fused signal recognition particle receptor